MALQKAIVQADGITTNYHRILFIDSMINSHISIGVLSYLDSDSRQNDSTDNPLYKKGVTYEKGYEENFTIESAYNYLKTLPEFEGSLDV